ncbi:hypothetical protein [Actinomadura madurae]|uniref:hypothetical protein n=1 Tax=Actinomadura madurae TaxID=1993 RepID=UPI001C43198D|nr:hypothetical protein [Actinomadura madurae]
MPDSFGRPHLPVIRPRSKPDLRPQSEFQRLPNGDRSPHRASTRRSAGFTEAWFPPPDLDTAAASAVLERQMPGAMAVMEPDAPGMHTTDSIGADRTQPASPHPGTSP